MKETSHELGNRTSRQALAWHLMLLVATLAAFYGICSFGSVDIAQPVAEATVAADAQAGGAPTKDRVLLHVLAALLVVILVGRLLGWALARLHQPPVMGDVLAGILIGPSFLGRLAPDAAAYVLPPSAVPYLAVVAQLGVVLYMFTVGLEFDIAVFRRQGREVLAISHASIAVPFLLGAGLAWFGYTALASPGVAFLEFALFLGVSLSITAFPVLARIVNDRGLQGTDLGLLALACAAVNDVAAWCLLALVVGIVQAEVRGALMSAVLAAGYIAAMFLVVKPLLIRLMPKDDDRLTQKLAALVFLGLLTSAWLTELIGLHAIFGAFLFGAAIPHDSVVARQFSHKLEDLLSVVLLPAFFAIAGLRTELGLVSGWNNWLWCGVIVLVATAGKFGATLAAARWCRMPWPESAGLGLLMNTRGLMELVVLSVGLDLGVISPRLFAMMVIMAIVTTLATSPLLKLIERRAAGGWR